MSLSTESMQTVMVEISRGVPKTKTSLILTPELSKFWEKVEPEIKAKMAEGLMLDFTPEAPEAIHFIPNRPARLGEDVRGISLQPDARAPLKKGEVRLS